MNSIVFIPLVEITASNDMEHEIDFEVDSLNNIFEWNIIKRVNLRKAIQTFLNLDYQA